MFTEITTQLAAITNLGVKIMAQVQLDQSVIDSAASALESLASADEALVNAVKDFLASPPAQALPAATLDGLNQALSDAATAQSDAATAQAALQNATPAAPTGPTGA
jgi:hypothetical protein